MKTTSTSLTSEQLWYIFGLYAPASVVGIQNPYTGQFAAEIKRSEQSALNNLLSRRILHLNANKALEFDDPAVKAMIEACLKPDRCLWIIASHGSQNKVIRQHFVYFQSIRIIDIFEDGSNSFELTQVQDIPSLTERLAVFLSHTAEYYGASHSFTLEKNTFDAALKAFDEGNDQSGREILSTTRIDEGSIEELASALGEQGSSLFAILVNNPNDPESTHVQGTGYLNSQSGGWLLKEDRQNGVDLLHFQPGTSLDYQKLTFALIQ